MPTSVTPIWPDLYRGAPENDSALTAPIGATFDAYTYQELVRIPEPTPIVEGMLFASSLAAIIGAFSTFKSFFALDIALHVATGLEWNGRAVTQGAVLYVYAEGIRGIRARVDAWSRANQTE